MTKPSELFDLTAKVALVTGAGSGLGRAFCLCLAGAGADVIAADRDGGSAAETVELVVAAGGRCSAKEVDVAEPASVAAMAEGVAASHGGADVLVNNAGIAIKGARTHELAIADWDELMGINLRGVFLCARALIPGMLERGGGSIINISSILGLVGHYPGFAMATAAYGAAKAGLIGLTRQMAVEYAPDNIRSNAIAPGWHGGTQLGTGYRKTMTNAEVARFEDAIVAGTPMGRRGRPEELDGLVVYLASDAAGFLTGQVIAHDGGWTAH